MCLGFSHLRKCKGRSRSGGPIGSSFPRHDAKERTRQTKKNQKRKQEKPRADCKLA